VKTTLVLFIGEQIRHQNVYRDNQTTLVKEDDLSVFDAVKMKMGLVDTSQGKLVCSHCTSVLSHVHWPTLSHNLGLKVVLLLESCLVITVFTEFKSVSRKYLNISNVNSVKYN